MAQTTNFNIKANLSGTAFRTNVNEKLAALLTQNSGQIEPTNPQQGMFWLDTSNENTHYLKIRGETIWSIVCSIDVATGTILYENVHNAISSTKLSNKKIIALQGDITANISTDFSTNVTLNTTFSENAVAPNSAKLNGLQASLSKAANTIAQRDSAGDITTRLFRSSYAENQASQNASICYRESSKESNNYHKFMTPAMFKSYLQNIGVKITDTQRAITDSVSTTSSEVCASATAVKNAYNRATQALNTANSVNNNTIYKPGSNVEAQVLDETSTRNATMTKVREITLPRSGVVTVTFTLKADSIYGDSSAKFEGNAQIYVNGVARGTLRSAVHTQRTNLTFSENITVNALDKIQLYIMSYRASLYYSCVVSNFKITVANPTAPFIL